MSRSLRTRLPESSDTDVGQPRTETSVSSQLPQEEPEVISDSEPAAPSDQYDYDLRDPMPPPEPPFAGFKQGNRVVITKDLIQGGLQGMSGTVNHRVMSTGDLNSVQGEVRGYFGVDLSHRTEGSQFIARCYLRLDSGIEIWMDEVNLAKEGSKGRSKRSRNAESAALKSYRPPIIQQTLRHCQFT